MKLLKPLSIIGSLAVYTMAAAYLPPKVRMLYNRLPQSINPKTVSVASKTDRSIGAENYEKVMGVSFEALSCILSTPILIPWGFTRYFKDGLTRSLSMDFAKLNEKKLARFRLLRSPSDDDIMLIEDILKQKDKVLDTTNLLLDSWENVSRGKDLFLKTMGGFDIGRAYNRWIDIRISDYAPLSSQTYFPERQEYIKRDRKTLSSILKDDLNRICSKGRTMNGSLYYPIRGDGQINKRTGKALPPLKKDLIEFLLRNDLDELNEIAYILLKEYSRKYEKSEHPGWGREIEPSVIIPAPAQLRCVGYFEEISDLPTLKIVSTILEADETSLAKQHLFRYIDWWRKNPELIHELVDAQNRNIFNESMVSLPPMAVLRRLRHLADIRLLEQRYGKEKTFDWLDSLEDEGNLKVLRSPFDVYTCGKRLNNCASSYIDKIEAQQIIFVALIVNYKYIALGSWNCKRKCWDQIKENRNSACSNSTNKIFQNYAKQLSAWSPKKNLMKT
uniref:Uncharacterized protein n=1 Tax=Aureoumbra lagunensis TaxID=44058 RepID=A0A7S3K480_9STRA|mmetsp:Transcript_1710/g.2258  ORF Transcript_1710/g.2258 Transcript_1710/m.2258 type:complete len:502 (-) Transcript_1710:402-1907(-)